LPFVIYARFGFTQRHEGHEGLLFSLRLCAFARNIFSRKGAKAQRLAHFIGEPWRLFFFAPLREKK